MSGRILGYVRVSTEEQNLARQLEAMGDVDLLFSDKMSGKNTNRKGLQEMFAEAREGDTIRVKSVDRLARSTRDLLTILDDFEERGISVEFLDTPYMNTNSKEGRFFLTILGALAEMERATICARQAEGIAIAKAQGKYNKDPMLTPEQVAEIRRRCLYENKTAMAKEYGVSRAVLYDAIYGERCYSKEAFSDVPPLPHPEPKPRKKPKEKKPGGGPALTVEEVAEIRRRVAAGETQSDVARDFGISRDLIKKAVLGYGPYGKGKYLTIPKINPHHGALTVKQVTEIRTRVFSGETQAFLAREFGVSEFTMSKAVRGLGAYGKGAYAKIPVLA